MPKYSATPFDQASLYDYDQKDNLLKMMMKSKSYDKHPAHRALYDALVQSLIVDEDDMYKQLEDKSTPNKRCRDDNDQDPSADVTVHDVEIEAEESVKDDVVDAENPTQADASDRILHDLSKPLPLHGASDAIFYKPRGVVYLNKDDKKYLMRANEVYKFGDGTLIKVRDQLDYMFHNLELGYNDVMPKRAWTGKDQKQTAFMMEKIKKTLLTRGIMKSLECFVGGRKIKIDYRRLTWTE
uniref:Uncharacterized protein n=1 Tax=Tanacetum cinerariifolium TaxID=118510 RepID=A0A6L2NHZ9_TANCI|nr:hypothetical protein [Tanacetum cinerariifolium]